MKLNYNIITQEAAKRGWSIAYLVEKLSMSRQGFDQMMAAKTMKVSTLEKLCEVLGVGVSFFFEDSAGVAGVVGGGVTQIGNIGGVGGNQVLHQNINSDAMKILALERENELLRNAIADKERIINLLTNK